MKKSKNVKLLAVLLSLVMVIGLIASCGSKGQETKETKSKESTMDVSESNSEADNKTDDDLDNSKKEGKLLYYTPFIGDFGLGDMGYRASVAASEKYDLDMKMVEYGQDSSVAVNSFLDAIETEKYDYIVASSWYINDVVKDIAPDYPDTIFILFDTSPDYDLTGIDNIYGITFGQNEGGFLVGVYSALMSKTGKIGCALRGDNPILNDFGTGWLNGYEYAVKELGCDVGFMYSYIGEDSVQNTYETCKVLYENGCDYVWSVAGTNNLGACQAASEVGGLENNSAVIGVDYDQWEYFKNMDDASSAVGYENLVTSMLKNIEPCVALIFENLFGERSDIQPGNSFYGVAVDGTGLAYNEHYKEYTPQEVQDQIQEISEKIKSGEIDVVSYFDFDSYDDFAAYRDDPLK